MIRFFRPYRYLAGLAMVLCLFFQSSASAQVPTPSLLNPTPMPFPYFEWTVPDVTTTLDPPLDKWGSPGWAATSRTWCQLPAVTNAAAEDGYQVGLRCIDYKRPMLSGDGPYVGMPDTPIAPLRILAVPALYSDRCPIDVGGMGGADPANLYLGWDTDLTEGYAYTGCAGLWDVVSVPFVGPGGKARMILEADTVYDYWQDSQENWPPYLPASNLPEVDFDVAMTPVSLALEANRFRISPPDTIVIGAVNGHFFKPLIGDPELAHIIGPTTEQFADLLNAFRNTRVHLTVYDKIIGGPDKAFLVRRQDGGKILGDIVYQQNKGKDPHVACVEDKLGACAGSCEPPYMSAVCQACLLANPDVVDEINTCPEHVSYNESYVEDPQLLEGTGDPVYIGRYLKPYIAQEPPCDEDCGLFCLDPENCDEECIPCDNPEQAVQCPECDECDEDCSGFCNFPSNCDKSCTDCDDVVITCNPCLGIGTPETPCDLPPCGDFCADPDNCGKGCTDCEIGIQCAPCDGPDIAGPPCSNMNSLKGTENCEEYCECLGCTNEYLAETGGSSININVNACKDPSFACYEAETCAGLGYEGKNACKLFCENCCGPNDNLKDCMWSQSFGFQEPNHERKCGIIFQGDQPPTPTDVEFQGDQPINSADFETRNTEPKTEEGTSAWFDSLEKLSNTTISDAEAVTLNAISPWGSDFFVVNRDQVPCFDDINFRNPQTNPDGSIVNPDGGMANTKGIEIHQGGGAPTDTIMPGHAKDKTCGYVAFYNNLINWNTGKPEVQAVKKGGNVLKIPVGINPRSAVVGDFNGDGNQDIAVTNTGNPADGVFGWVSIISCLPAPSPKYADPDNNPDIANPLCKGGALTVFDYPITGQETDSVHPGEITAGGFKGNQITRDDAIAFFAALAVPNPAGEHCTNKVDDDDDGNIDCYDPDCADYCALNIRACEDLALTFMDNHPTTQGDWAVLLNNCDTTKEYYFNEIDFDVHKKTDQGLSALYTDAAKINKRIVKKTSAYSSAPRGIDAHYFSNNAYNDSLAGMDVLVSLMFSYAMPGLTFQSGPWVTTHCPDIAVTFYNAYQAGIYRNTGVPGAELENAGLCEGSFSLAEQDISDVVTAVYNQATVGDMGAGWGARIANADMGALYTERTYKDSATTDWYYMDPETDKLIFDFQFNLTPAVLSIAGPEVKFFDHPYSGGDKTVPFDINDACGADNFETDLTLTDTVVNPGDQIPCENIGAVAAQSCFSVGDDPVTGHECRQRYSVQEDLAGVMCCHMLERPANNNYLQLLSQEDVYRVDGCPYRDPIECCRLQLLASFPGGWGVDIPADPAASWEINWNNPAAQYQGDVCEDDCLDQLQEFTDACLPENMQNYDDEACQDAIDGNLEAICECLPWFPLCGPPEDEECGCDDLPAGELQDCCEENAVPDQDCGSFIGALGGLDCPEVTECTCADLGPLQECCEEQLGDDATAETCEELLQGFDPEECDDDGFNCDDFVEQNPAFAECCEMHNGIPVIVFEECDPGEGDDGGVTDGGEDDGGDDGGGEGDCDIVVNVYGDNNCINACCNCVNNQNINDCLAYCSNDCDSGDQPELDCIELKLQGFTPLECMDVCDQPNPPAECAPINTAKAACDGLLTLVDATDYSGLENVGKLKENLVKACESRGENAVCIPRHGTVKLSVNIPNNASQLEALGLIEGDTIPANLNEVLKASSGQITIEQSKGYPPPRIEATPQVAAVETTLQSIGAKTIIASGSASLGANIDAELGWDWKDEGRAETKEIELQRFDVSFLVNGQQVDCKAPDVYRLGGLYGGEAGFGGCGSSLYPLEAKDPFRAHLPLALLIGLAYGVLFAMRRKGAQ